MTDVTCRVDSCYYWGNNDKCKADSITVDHKSASGKTGKADFEAGDLDARTDSKDRSDPRSGNSGRSKDEDMQKASTSHDTLCRTFKPKGSESRH